MKKIIAYLFISFGVLNASVQVETSLTSTIDRRSHEIRMTGQKDFSLDQFSDSILDHQISYFQLENAEVPIDPSLRERLEKKEKGSRKNPWNAFQNRLSGYLEAKSQKERSELYKRLKPRYVRENDIQKVILRSCNIDDEVLSDILVQMELMDKLSVVDLENNKITLKGLEKLMGFVRLHKTVNFINVRHNNFSAINGIVYLIEHLYERSQDARDFLDKFIIVTEVDQEIDQYYSDSWQKKHIQYDKREERMIKDV